MFCLQKTRSSHYKDMSRSLCTSQTGSNRFLQNSRHVQEVFEDMTERTRQIEIESESTREKRRSSVLSPILSSSSHQTVTGDRRPPSLFTSLHPFSHFRSGIPQLIKVSLCQHLVSSKLRLNMGILFQFFYFSDLSATRSRVRPLPSPSLFEKNLLGHGSSFSS